MSETRFTLRRPDPDPAADVESYIDHGTSALPAAAEASARASERGEDPPPRRAAATQHPPQIQAAGRGQRDNHVRPLPCLGGRGA